MSRFYPSYSILGVTLINSNLIMDTISVLEQQQGSLYTLAMLMAAIFESIGLYYILGSKMAAITMAKVHNTKPLFVSINSQVVSCSFLAGDSEVGLPLQRVKALQLNLIRGGII